MAALFERTMPSDYSRLSPLADEVGAFLDTHVGDEDVAYRALLLTTEAVTNAMEHGNGLDEAKSVFLRVAAESQRVEISVEDEGPGFDPDAAPDAVVENDPLAEGGRGLFLMRAYAQSLRFENSGRRVVLVVEPA